MEERKEGRKEGQGSKEEQGKKEGQGRNIYMYIY